MPVSLQTSLGKPSGLVKNTVPTVIVGKLAQLLPSALRALS
jgi:hypothetical protein